MYIHSSQPSLFLRLLLLLLGLRRRQLMGVGLPVNTGTNLLPSAGSSLKVTEGLGELQGFRDDAFLLLVVPDLGVTGQGEVLAEGVALEAVVGHDTAEIRVAGEEDAEEIVDLSLVPVGSVEEADDAGDGGDLVGVGLDADPGVVADAQEVVDDLESLVTGGEVDCGDGADCGELGSSVV
jgi:hypothetical protein